MAINSNKSWLLTLLLANFYLISYSAFAQEISENEVSRFQFMIDEAFDNRLRDVLEESLTEDFTFNIAKCVNGQFAFRVVQKSAFINVMLSMLDSPGLVSKERENRRIIVGNHGFNAQLKGTVIERESLKNGEKITESEETINYLKKDNKLLITSIFIETQPSYFINSNNLKQKQNFIACNQN